MKLKPAQDIIFEDFENRNKKTIDNLLKRIEAARSINKDFIIFSKFYAILDDKDKGIFAEYLDKLGYFCYKFQNKKQVEVNWGECWGSKSAIKWQESENWLEERCI